MRKAGQQFLRQPSQSSSLLDPSAQCRVRKPAQAEQRIGNGPKGGEARVEAVGRILEDHLDLCAKRAAPEAPRRYRRDFLVFELDRAFGRIDQAREESRKGRLAAARLADEPDRFAVPDRKTDAVDR